MIMTMILTLTISEFGVLIDQKVPVAPSCRGTRPIYRSERGGRTGHREGALPNWSQVWGGIRGQMCPNPTHLTRPRTVNRRVKVASASAQWRGRIGGSALDAFSQLKSTLKVWKLVNTKLWYSDVVLHYVSTLHNFYRTQVQSLSTLSDCQLYSAAEHLDNQKKQGEHKAPSVAQYPRAW